MANHRRMRLLRGIVRFRENLNEWPDVIILIRRNEAFGNPPGSPDGRVPGRVSPFSAWLKTHGIAKGRLQCWQTSRLMCRPKYLWWLFMVRTYISTFIPLPGCRPTSLGPRKSPPSILPASLVVVSLSIHTDIYISLSLRTGSLNTTVATRVGPRVRP